MKQRFLGGWGIFLWHFFKIWLLGFVLSVCFIESKLMDRYGSAASSIPWRGIAVIMGMAVIFAALSILIEWGGQIKARRWRWVLYLLIINIGNALFPFPALGDAFYFVGGLIGQILISFAEGLVFDLILPPYKSKNKEDNQ